MENYMDRSGMYDPMGQYKTMQPPPGLSGKQLKRWNEVTRDGQYKFARRFKIYSGDELAAELVNRSQYRSKQHPPQPARRNHHLNQFRTAIEQNRIDGEIKLNKYIISTIGSSSLAALDTDIDLLFEVAMSHKVEYTNSTIEIDLAVVIE